MEKKTSLFDFLKAINKTKANILNKDNIKEYKPFTINQGLSYYPDTILYANQMNLTPDLDKDQHFSFLINIIRPRDRFEKWNKKEKNDDLAVIMEYYGYSLNKAKSVLSIFTSAQIENLKEKINKGGT